MLHKDLVALESELALSRARTQRTAGGRAGRVRVQARALANRGERRLRAVASHLPGSLKPALHALRRAAILMRLNEVGRRGVRLSPDSAVAHRLLDGLAGIEIGASAHNPFHIPGCLTVDYTDKPTLYTEAQLRLSGEVTRVDIVSPGDDLPFPDGSLDYVLSSHVLEHFYDSIGTLQEWTRVVRPGGYLFMIVPHRDRTFDRERPLTSVEELRGRRAACAAAAARHKPIRKEDAHHSVWTTESFLELCAALSLRVVHVDDVDDKVGNGFTVVIRR